MFSIKRIWEFTLRILCIFALVSISTLAFGQQRIIHSPPPAYMPGESIEIEAIVEGVAQEVNSVQLLYKTPEESIFQETGMEFRYGYYYGVIPPEYATGEGVHYLITVTLADGQQLVYPQDDPYESPVYLPASRKNGSQNKQPDEKAPNETADTTIEINPSDLIISPEPGENISAEEALVAISLYSIDNVDSASILLSVDAENVTKRANISQNLVVYRPENLRPGRHMVKLFFSNSAGQSFEPLSWEFTIAGEIAEDVNALNLDGKVFIESNQTRIRNQTENINKLGGSFRGRYGHLKFDGNIYLTSQENPGRQPRNRYLFRVGSKHFNMELGDSYPRISELGMWGKRVRGINSSVSLGTFSMQMVYGRSKRPLGGRLLPFAEQNTASRYSAELVGYSFGRRVFALKPTIGRGEKFQLGFSVISTRDDTSSVKKSTDDLSGDEVKWGGSTPKDNIVFGSELFFAFDKRRIIWESSASISWQNNSIFGGALGENDTLKFGNEYRLLVNDFPLNPSNFDKIFIINSNMYPYLPMASIFSTRDTNGSNYELKLHPFRFNDYRSLAYQTEVRLNYLKNTLGIKYRKVGDAYSALTNPYLRKDLAGFEISDRVRLLQNKVYLNIAYENLEEGLSRTGQYRINSENIRSSLAIYPGENFPNINLSFNQYGRRNGIETVRTDTISAGDSLRYLPYDNRINNAVSTSTVSVNQRVYFLGLEHQASIHMMRSARNDKIERISKVPASDYTLNMYSVTIRSHFDFPLTTNLSFNLNDNDASLGYSQFQIVSAGARTNLFQDKLIINADYRRTESTGTNPFIRDDFETTMYVNIYPYHRISLNARIASTELVSETYSDFIYSLRYEYQF